MAPSISWRRDGGMVVPLGAGSCPDTPAGRAALLAPALPPQVVARRTAAWIWGLDVLPPGAPEASWEADLIDPDVESVGDDPCRVELPSGHVVEEAGVRLTTLARTALDCARWLPPADALAALDQFLRNGVADGELRRMARDLPGYRNSSRLREVLRLGDTGADSPGESRTRHAVVHAGFPRPTTQIPVEGPGDITYHVDLGYEPYRVGLEYDGEAYHTGRRDRVRDTHRRRWLERQQGWEVIPVTRDFLSRPAPYLEALLTALLSRGWEPNDVTMDRISTRLTRLRRAHRTGGRRHLR